MLKATKITNYEGNILIDGIVVLKYHATVNNGNLSYTNQDIIDFSLYRKNRTIVKNELSKFEDKIMEEIENDKDWISMNESENSVDTILDLKTEEELAK